MSRTTGGSRRLPRSSAPSMTDVAAHIGVSHQTVSRVLNAPDTVAPRTRERVEAAIAELGYRRNSAARALVTRRTRVIGVASSGQARFGPANMTIAIEEAARDAGYATTLMVLRDGAADSVDSALEHFLAVGVDGLVVIGAQTHIAEAARALAHRLPVVLIAAGMRPSAGEHVVAVDQELGASRATRHLLDLGHRDVLHIAGPQSWFDARARIAGWRREMRAAGIADPPLSPGGWDAQDGVEVARRLIDEGRLPTAIFAANDQLALGVMHAAREHGLRVPEDLSVVGFDDVEGAQFFAPPLTTVRQPFADVGHRSIDVLLGALDGEPDEPIDLPPELLVRGSTAPPAAPRATDASRRA